MPPRVRQFGELRHCDPGSGRTTREQAIDVLLRPEEVHRASRKDDVFPPVRGGNEAVEHEALVVRTFAAHLDHDRVGAVRAARLDATVDAERRADPERVPGAVGVPPATGGLDSVRRGNAGEGVRHADLARLVVEDERVCPVKPAPTHADMISVDTDRAADLGGQRGAAERDEEPVRRVAKLEVAGVDAGILL
jgi:hypothetical protein